LTSDKFKEEANLHWAIVHERDIKQLNLKRPCITLQVLESRVPWSKIGSTLTMVESSDAFFLPYRHAIKAMQQLAHPRGATALARIDFNNQFENDAIALEQFQERVARGRRHPLYGYGFDDDGIPLERKAGEVLLPFEDHLVRTIKAVDLPSYLSSRRIYNMSGVFPELVFTLFFESISNRLLPGHLFIHPSMHGNIERSFRSI
jgi:hypothetical protein